MEDSTLSAGLEGRGAFGGAGGAGGGGRTTEATEENAAFSLAGTTSYDVPSLLRARGWVDVDWDSDRV